MKKLFTPEEAVKLINDGDTVATTGSGGAVLEPGLLLEMVEKSFLETGHPCDMTFVHATGLGDKKSTGTNRFAHEKMVKRVIGGHWGWSPRMAELANNNKIEAYNLPQGVMTQLYREIAAKRPGLLTHIGLKTFVDPRVEGGKLNKVTTEDLVELIVKDGKEYLLYKAFPIDVAIIRGTTADEDGNISMEEEAVFLEVLALAQAARNSGGKVICQVKHIAKAGTLNPKDVKIPGILVDAVVQDKGQWQTSEGEFNPGFSGQVKIPLGQLNPMPLNQRKVIARRAAMELFPGAVVNLGFGMPDGVAAVAAEEGVSEYLTLTIEQGIVGGVPAQGDIFGVATNPASMIDEPSQFDFYSGGGLDITFLGLAQADMDGNVNVSKFGPNIAGCGGFIDISQSAKKVVFCGTFTAGGLKVEVKDGKLSILNEGKHKKFIKNVEQITFSGEYAKEINQKVIYVTERAIFELTEEGLTLIEIAPGIDLEKDIIQKMDFKPIIDDNLKIMDVSIFHEDNINLKNIIKNY
ncbi:Acetate CoA-transferase YdiF [Tepidanaerobacter acetatoxydans Re1]|uniref:Acetate CoA-transferase YdiF n=1 Tax=Tepidanaerobacter acetatoxydans (strain DSM 21804 / JCM 16047 / Re1) TaxID=1209989 RepID=F4LXM8_TEPAE|nr:acyl CoA:acetate/3-ketoacid CoA transferase [Tepidanaerobacter acetatoxydans]AEE91957.1 coenzyme A transferase [Tepidanaerobacter acetatoxydans Re1]CCP26788.1 Acetate CoA-transferase YdiF [Tepidanaerobacter acetatoxydans Re1]